MADEFLTQELPAIRRAQERTLVALRSMIWLVDGGLWASWSDPDFNIIPPEADIRSLGPDVTPSPRPAESGPGLPLATFAVCLDAIDSIAEARGILPLPNAADIRRAADKLRTRMVDDLKEVSANLTHTLSRAFGQDDPLTASWLLPILRKDPVPVPGSGSAELFDKSEPKLGGLAVCNNVYEGIKHLLSPSECMITGGLRGRKNTAEDHAWPASLAVRALNLVTRGEPKRALDPPDAEALRLWSEEQVRLQLARSVTREGGQDAAHLAAALAVAMWLEELPLPLLEAAVEQLCAMQRPDGSLVLTRPYVADTEGSVITPLAADVTLAMIAVADQLNARYPEHPTVLRIERHLLEAVQRQREAYFQSSVRKGGTGPSREEAMIWPSAHAKPEPGSGNVWATARTVTALVMILNLESRLITQRLLDESRFSYRRGRDIEKGFDILVDPERGDVPAAGDGRMSLPAAGKPELIVAPNYASSPLTVEVSGSGFGPADQLTVTCDGQSDCPKADESGCFETRLRVRPNTRPGIMKVLAKGKTSEAEGEFRRTIVSALRDGLTAPDLDSVSARAVLLRGPPGTSKTSLIEAVAKQLDGDLDEKGLGRYVVYLVQLSPADFLLDGPDKVEHRAKRIFDYLTQMENVVVLFDEIDRLVLDRDAPEYKQQADVFQFMTPSMLPKIAALRRRGSVIRFAIATNYAEQIDPAITRKGRIDESFVIPPPNFDARRQILKAMDTTVAERLAAVTPLWVYGELKTLRGDESPEAIMLQRPDVSLASYRSRQGTPRKEVLASEILQLAELYFDGRGLDVLKERGPGEVEAIVWASDNVSGDNKKTAAGMIERLKTSKGGAVHARK